MELCAKDKQNETPVEHLKKSIDPVGNNCKLTEENDRCNSKVINSFSDKNNKKGEKTPERKKFQENQKTYFKKLSFTTMPKIHEGIRIRLENYFFLN